MWGRKNPAAPGPPFKSAIYQPERATIAPPAVFENQEGIDLRELKSSAPF